MASLLECEASILRSIHSSGKLIKVNYLDRQYAQQGGHCGLGGNNIHESQDLVYVGQPYLRFKVTPFV